jgi:aspartokinase
MKKVPVGGMLIDRDLTYVRIYNLPDEPDWSGMALEEFCFYGLTINFISENRDRQGHANMSLTLKVQDAEMFAKAVAAVEGLHEAIKIETIDSACLLTVYGPHFKERCGLAATAFRALGIQGINILGISTSISSISAVIAEADLEAAELALDSVFELP